jgi:predicted phage terminase large subunit-like protein
MDGAAVIELARKVTVLDVHAERARRSFAFFFEHFAWPALQPGVPYERNWHIDVICMHLEAIKRAEIKKLIINMPFRMLKSTLISQAFQAWDWVDNPEMQYLTSSYARDLAIRDAVATRRIIESPKYQAAWGHRFKLAGDQNTKSRVENNKGGSRVVTSTDSAATGFGGNRRIIDDPISPREADSGLAIERSIEWWRGTMATRGNDPKSDVTVLVHQRLNEQDLTGYLLREEGDWEHLIFPMRYEKQYAKTTSLGYHDPRTVDGELLFPARIDEAAVKLLEKSLGVYHTNAQLQQRPEPRGGIIFDRKYWRYWKALPELEEVVISVDASFKDLQTSDYVAIQAWGNKGANKYLLRRIKERMGFKATCEAVKGMAALYPDCVAVLIEDKANGSAIIETLTSEVAGVIAVQPDGGKAARAYAMQPEQEAGNVWFPDPSIDQTIEVMVSACCSFTGQEGGDDDEVDAMTQLCNWRRVRDRASGLQDWMRQQAEAIQAQRQVAAAQ